MLISIVEIDGDDYEFRRRPVDHSRRDNPMARRRWARQKKKNDPLEADRRIRGAHWVNLGTVLPPMLFWRPKYGPTLGFIHGGELFDAKWIYVCNSNKVSDLRRALTSSSWIRFDPRLS